MNQNWEFPILSGMEYMYRCLGPNVAAAAAAAAHMSLAAAVIVAHMSLLLPMRHLPLPSSLPSLSLLLTGPCWGVTVVVIVIVVVVVISTAAIATWGDLSLPKCVCSGLKQHAT